jgi:hypothetical protein
MRGYALLPVVVHSLWIVFFRVFVFRAFVIHCTPAPEIASSRGWLWAVLAIGVGFIVVLALTIGAILFFFRSKTRTPPGQK